MVTTLNYSNSFNQLSNEDAFQINGGDIYDTFMTVAEFTFVTGAGAVGSVAGGAAGTALTGGNPVGGATGAVLGGGAAGGAAQKAWNYMFE